MRSSLAKIDSIFSIISCDIQQETLIKNQAARILETGEKSNQQSNQNKHSPFPQIFELSIVGYYHPSKRLEIKLFSTYNEKNTAEVLSFMEALDLF